MSRAPVERPPKKSAATRSFTRRQRIERERAQRRRLRQAQSRRPTGLRELRALLRRVPLAAWICAMIAVLNATAWSVITPPFQGRDEVDHFAYVATLVETGKQPRRTQGGFSYSSQEYTVLNGLHYGEVRFTPYQRSLSSDGQQATLEKDASAKLSLSNSPTANGASTEPPLFYAIQSVPYALGGGDILVKLQLMRLLDALLGGITALLVFFFVRETVPSARWAATAAAICVALSPMFAFTTGSLNPDALIYPLSAAVFLLLARAFHRPLTIPMAITLGAVLAASLLTYFSLTGVVFGAIVGLLILAARDARWRGMGRSALKAPAIAIAIGVSPGVIYGLSNLAKGHPLLGSLTGTGHSLGHSSLLSELSYIWQLFLPRLPGMTHYFEGISTWREIWFDRSVGFYGWMDTMFPSWVQNLAFVLAIATALLCGAELLRHRTEIRARLPELASYAAIAVGVLVMLGVASYGSDVVEHELAYGEPRYLLPLLPLFAAAIALAIRGAGRRWVPIAGAAMIVLFLGHDLFSQLQVIARYYG